MLWIGIITFLLLSALFSGSEIAYVSANKLRVELKKKRGTYRSHILANFFDRPSAFLSTMLVGNNIALVAFTYLITRVLEPLVIASTGLESDLIVLFINTLLITIIVLIFGEYLPKTLFRLFADNALYFLAAPLRWLQIILFPVSWVMTKASDYLLRLVFSQPSEQLETVLTRLDLENFINESGGTGEEENVIDKELFGKALNLHEQRVRDCMVPRNEVESIDVNSSIEELEALFLETRLSRIVVIDGDINKVLGYVHHQQLLEYPEAIRDCILELRFIPEVTRLPDMLDKAVSDSFSIACVVDEFGEVSGIITLEDILEEIFGEIEDEYDDSEYIDVVEEEGKTYLFSGRLEISYLTEKYSLEFPEGEYQTLSGYIISTTENIPEAGEEFRIENYLFEFVNVSNTRIETVRLRVVPEE